MKKAHVGSTLESLFEETGEIGEVRALAVKKMIVRQYLAAMNERKLTVSALSGRDVDQLRSLACSPLNAKVVGRLPSAAGGFADRRGTWPCP